MRRAFTLIELLVVVAIISILMAVGIPVLQRAQERSREAVCQSNLRQMALMLKTYGNDHDGLFPQAELIYHSRESLEDKWTQIYPLACRWHDARIGPDSHLLHQEHPELRGSLWPYLGDIKIIQCNIGLDLGSCTIKHSKDHLPLFQPQYSYAMNGLLSSHLMTGGSATGSADEKIDVRTIRETEIRRETQVTRSPSEVFAFGEQNSWSINIKGLQPPYRSNPGRAARYDLSGPNDTGGYGATYLGAMRIEPTREVASSASTSHGIGDAFATYHRPRRGDPNTGRSFVSMLDGHVQQVTVADQLRKSRRIEGLSESRLGPGGNLRLAWPLDIPPPGGWENQ